MAIKGVLFDKDGTLLDFHATWVPVNRAVARVVAEGDEVLASALLKAGGQDDETELVESGSLLATANTQQIAAAWAELVPHRGVADLVRLIDQVFQREGAITAVAVPKLGDVVRSMTRRGLNLGVATSDSRSGALATLRPFGILEQMRFIAGYDSGFGTKPDPGMVMGFCEATKLLPEEVLVAGDNPHDLEMGRRAGVGMCVGVLTGTSRAEQLSGLADHVVDSIADIEGLL